MARGKYMKDYILEAEYNPRTGKMKKVPKYTGPYFAFSDLNKVKKTKPLFLLLSVLEMAAFFTMMFINAPCGHVFYVMVPLVVTLIFYFYHWASMLRLYTAKEKVTREHKDKIQGRFKMTTMATLILTGIAFIGHIVFDIMAFSSLSGPEKGVEILFFVMKAVILAAATLMFVKAKDFDMQEIEKIDPDSAEKAEDVSK